MESLDALDIPSASLRILGFESLRRLSPLCAVCYKGHSVIMQDRKPLMFLIVSAKKGAREDLV